MQKWQRAAHRRCKSSGIWPLSQAAEACFGTPQWPAERPVPQVSIEFHLPDTTAVGPGGTGARGGWLRTAAPPAQEPWVTRWPGCSHRSAHSSGSGWRWNGRPVRWVPKPFVARRNASVEAGRGRRRTVPPGTIQQLGGFHDALLWTMVDATIVNGRAEPGAAHSEARAPRSAGRLRAASGWSILLPETSPKRSCRSAGGPGDAIGPAPWPALPRRCRTSAVGPRARAGVTAFASDTAGRSRWGRGWLGLGPMVR